MSKIIFTGGSITSGEGWSIPNHPDHWTSLCHKNIIPFVPCSLINYGIPGASNDQVFRESIKAISSHNDIKYLICSWVSILRYRFHVGFELYDTSETWTASAPGHKSPGHNINSGNFSRNYLNDLKNRFLSLHHDHNEICKLIENVSIINQLCKIQNIKVIHINDSCPWDKNYFIKIENSKPNQYTEFTKNNILYVNNRDDEEIYLLYDKMHNDIKRHGGVYESEWVNLYDSFISLQIDFNDDNVHPGKLSNQEYFNLVKNYVEYM